ncbi:MAG: hypothetical protein ABDH21_02695 [bacterium]
MVNKSKKATLVLYDIFIEQESPPRTLKEIVKKYKQEEKENRDKILCQQIIPLFENYINKLAYKYHTFDKEDIKQIAILAIIKALQNYQETYEDPTPFILCYIEKEIKNYVMRQDIIKIPKTIRKLYYQIQKYISLKPNATISEISEKFNITETAVKEILSLPQKENIDVSVIRSKKHKDLDLPIEDKIFLEQIMSKFSEIEKKVIKFLFFEDITKTMIAQKLNISRKYLYSILNSIKQKIQKTTNTNG